MLPRFFASRSNSKTLTVLVCFSLLMATLTPFAVANGAGSSFLRSRAQDNGSTPISGAPEGTLPNLDQVKVRQPPVVRAPQSVASTVRSRRNPLAPRTRRVGDPLPTPSVLPTPTNLPTPPPLPSPSVPPPHVGAAINSDENLWGTSTNGGLLKYLLAWNGPTSITTKKSIQFDSSLDVQSSHAFDFFLLPMPQAGNSKIVFASNRDGSVQIYSMNTDGSGLARLTINSSNDDHPRWSPNGTKILFQSDRDSTPPDPENPGPTKQDIYVMNADGSGQTRLTTDSADDCNAEWSPDGSKIVFQSLRNGSYYQVYLMNPDGTGQANLSNSSAADLQPSWSPNGSKIAFASERDHAGVPAVYVMNSNGSNQTRLTFTGEPFKDAQPIWSRDALKIAFVSTRDSVIETWQETDDDGNYMQKSAIDTNKEIYLMNADGSNQVRLTNALESDDSPSWSPDNTKIIFHSDRERDTSDPTQQLWTMNVDGTNQSLIASNEFRDYSPSWSNNVANQSPVANSGGPYSGVIAQNIAFSSSGSFDPDGTISSYSWTFGDGGSGSGVTPTHSYASAGTYNVSLTVTDNLGAQATANTNVTVSTAGSDQYLASFNLAALARQPYTNESSYWNDILRAAYPNGQTSMVLAMRELGKTLFESSDYAARNRNNHWYVYDLYKTYLMREPDVPGWAYWESVVPANGRENVRRAFDECSEFAGIVATLTPSGAPSGSVSSLASALVDPFNQPGNGLTSRDAEWSVSLLSLPGRAGLDFGLSLSYSSMIWTHSGPYIYFDEDNGWPSPGFRLGFPTVQQKSFDAQAGRNVYLLIAGGSRVSLRQVETSNVYEAADSSYLQLSDNGGSLLLRTTDGTQLNYLIFNNEWHCTQIKDRNGNYIAVNYDWLGHITTIIDTLARTITFNYDGNANLTSITQSWTGQSPPHTWASFGWTTKTVQPSFSGVMVVGASPSTIPVLNQVGLNDGTRYTFEYNTTGQLNPVRSYRSDNVERAYTAYDYNSPADDCPRLIDTYVWAQNWTGINGVPQEVATNYDAPGDGSHTITTQDGTMYKEFYAGSAGFQSASPWARGLVARTEILSGGVTQKSTTTNWTQDNTGVSYQTNPRATETNVYDSATPQNHRRATVSYAAFVLPSGASCSLPTDTREYAGDATTIMRRSHTDYRMDATADVSYLSRHIIGLVKEQALYEVSGAGEMLMSKVGYQYDQTGSIQGSDAPVQHDNSYDSNFLVGRANLSSMKRYDVTNSGQWTVSSVQYNTAGAVVSATDPLGHQSLIAYTDSFSADGDNLDAPRSFVTLAYPTTITDADGNNSYVRYRYDFGARTRVQGPPPQNQSQGAIQLFTYDNAARMERVTTANNNAYTSYVYGPDYVLSLSTVNSVADEAYSTTVFDGMGRTIVAASNHPGSIGGYSASSTIYDQMGRAIKQSNPTETNSGWAPTGDDAAGWVYTQQTYDWKGRPLVTTNPSITSDPNETTRKEASYSGCGCAGGEVTTLTDEGTIDAGVAKRRQQKIYADVLGRTVKTELLNWQGGSVYATTVNTYNARDQVKLVRQFQGEAPSDLNDLSCPIGTCQQTTMTFDGYGRLKNQHAPEQQVDPYNSASTDHTTWDYNLDDTIQKITDARGVITNFGYNNNRGLVTSLTYDSSNVPASANVAPAGAANFTYDAAGNRTSMTDGLGSTSYAYDQLSRLASETRALSVGTFTLSYNYNLANELTSVTDPWNATVSYGLDTAGRLNNITGTGYPVSQFASNMQYRAWGTLKSETYGNGFTEAAGYNSRLQLTGFEVRDGAGQLKMSRTHQYYADGNLKFSQNPLDERFDRAYSYDHIRRGNEAYSGSEARDFVNGTNSGTPTGPYRQSYQYSSFNQVAQQTNRLWSENETVGNTFLNNRRQYWGYDAAGAVVYDDETGYMRDAAGRTVQADSETSHGTYTFDGDGQALKTVLTTPSSHGGTRTTTVYYLYSSVLGLAVAELNNTGLKTKRYVYAGAQKIAEESYAGTLTWSHAEPVTGSRGDSTSGGFYIPKAEFNADGINVGFSAPESTGFDSPDPIARWGNVGLGSSCSVGNLNCVTCYLDQFEHDCGQVSWLMSIGLAAQCPNNDCGPRRVRGRDGNPHLTPLTTNPKNGTLGYWPDGYNAPGVIHDAFGNPMRLSPDSSSSAPFGGGTPIYGRFGVSAGVDENGNPTDPTDWEYYITGYTMPLSLATSINPQKLSMPSLTYNHCAKKLGRGVPMPEMERARLISQAARDENIAPELLAVTVSAENGKWFAGGDDINGRHGGGTADVGPGQLDYAGLQNWPALNGLDNVWGTNTGVGQTFNGNDRSNLRASARYIQDLGGGREGTIHYHSGRGPFSRKPEGQVALQKRTREYDQRANSYRDFFNCLRSSLAF
ncbi:MAG: hypothetical protein QOF62_1814 [Pyrinomonadaceae bacterium]|jgi:YD repeat-containing protein|nr:hypothetical protein [Pyrinomonadaceae bacterium]